MADDLIVPEKLNGFESHLGAAERIGPLRVHTARGPVVATDAPGFTTMIMRAAGDPEYERIVFMLYAPGDGCDGTGMMAQMDATQARSVASSLLRLASLIDTGKPN